MSSLGGPPCCGCDSGGTYQRGGGGGCGGGVINWAYSVLWGSKGSGVRGGSRAMSRDGGHGKGVGPGGWGGAFMIAEVSYARSWGLREGSCPRRFEAVAVGLGGVRGGVWGARVGWGWV